jgi:CHAD domain-containing protein
MNQTSINEPAAPAQMPQYHFPVPPPAALPVLAPDAPGSAPDLPKVKARPPVPVPAPAPITPRFLRRPVGSWLAGSLFDRWQVFQERLHDCQEDSSETAVHDFRVATRRLMAQFDLLDAVIPSNEIHKSRRTLKRHLKALSALRDVQVQHLYVEQHLATFPELVLLRNFLEKRERRLAKAASADIRTFKTRKIERRVHLTLDQLALIAREPRRHQELSNAVIRVAEQAFSEVVRRRRAIKPDEIDTVHRTRLAFKRFRYMLESVPPDIAGLDQRRLRALSGYQRRMGIIQDLEVVQSGVMAFVGNDRALIDLLQPFCRRLQQSRVRALRAFTKSADELFGFWPQTDSGKDNAPLASRQSAA